MLGLGQACGKIRLHNGLSDWLSHQDRVGPF
jgi:hypothetical protein